MAMAMIEIDDALLRRWPLPDAGAAADKEARGRTLVVAGSAEMPGAAWLAAVAALRAGAGKLVVATAASVAAGLALRLPEARVLALAERDGALDPGGVDALDGVLGGVDAVLVGPGQQGDDANVALTRALLARAGRASVVLDAWAMNVVGHLERFDTPPLLTPHAGEMAHLCGIDKERVVRDAERVAADGARRWNAVVALKGATTVIASPDGRCWRHRGGNPGLATSGSGDVLAGIVVGLAARGAPLEQAAAWGVALHARAGDALAASRGPLGYLASELAAEVPCLMAGLARPEEHA